MSHVAIDLRAKLAAFSDHWAPRIVAECNDHQLKLAKLCGEFVWHRHDDCDETFLCLQGSLTIHMRDGSVTLREGELFVVPRGVEHKPVAERECAVLLIEPRGVVNTGDAGGERTAAGDVWV